MDVDLNPRERSYLSDCRLVAAENHAFYQRIYDGAISCFDQEILGRVMAQKKEFIDAILPLLKTGDRADPNQRFVPKTQDFVLALPPNDVIESNQSSIRQHVFTHEGRFEDALRLTIANIEDEATLKLLEHHRRAGEIAKNALLG